MKESPRQTADKSSRHRPKAVFSLVLSDGRIVESVYRGSERRTRFCVWQDGAWKEETSVEGDGVRFVPYSPDNNLLEHGVVLLPSGPAEYDTDAGLLAEIHAFIHRYVDLSPAFERLATYYVLLTWIYDGFNELPYLRVRGEPGSGKTRFLQVVGSVCYKPIFASGASTVSPIFRILDAVRGTLVLDESDFRFSDEQAEVVKILNNGNARGFPVLRSDLVGRHEYDPHAYTVFGPKILATRGFFDDQALESRFVTEDMRARMRRDIPITLPACAEDEALALRNKLLLFRFKNYGRRTVGEAQREAGIEPRLIQVFGPLFAIIENHDAAASLADLMRQLQRQHIADRGMETEAHVLDVIRDLLDSGDGLSIREITQSFSERFGEEYEHKVTRRWIGWVIRRKLLLKTQKSRGVFTIPPSEVPALKRLFERYDVASSTDQAREADASAEVPEVPQVPSTL